MVEEEENIRASGSDQHPVQAPSPQQIQALGDTLRFGDEEAPYNMDWSEAPELDSQLERDAWASGLQMTQHIPAGVGYLQNQGQPPSKVDELLPAS